MKNINSKTPREESFKIYQQAKRFELAGTVLNDAAFRRHNELFLPAYTNIGISFELYLKALINYEKGEFPSIHKLDELFFLLSYQFQHAIVLNFKREVKKMDPQKIIEVQKHSKVKISDDLVSNLKDLSRSIVDLRYYFDMDISKGLNLFFIQEIKIAITSFAEPIFEKRP